MKQLLLLVMISLPILSQAQDCNCASNFQWAKTIIEENDAGFAFTLENKGESAYEKHNEIFEEKVKTIKNLEECRQTIYEWLTFFRTGHIGIGIINQQGGQSGEVPNPEDISMQFKDWEKLPIDLPKFRQYLEAKKEHDYEGIWSSPPYEIGIKKVGDEYLGFIIEADGVWWKKGQVKLRINKDNETTFYMRDHSAQNFDDTKVLGNNYLQAGFIGLQRTFPELKTDEKVEKYLKAMSTRSPYFERVDDQTVLLRIPTFTGSEKKNIDAVIEANRELILKTPNLIIDLRNNGGGSDNSFNELLPLLYTNPIRTVGVEMYSTPLNNQRMLDFINKEEYGFDEAGKKWAQKSYDKLSKRLNEFVMMNQYPVTVTSYDTVYPYPRNIGIIINENNASTTEQFLLAAKQSKKVKLYGTTTAGILDISNMYFVNSPCDEFQLGYSLSKSMRIPHMTIDDKGIQPDYYMDNDIPGHEWVEYVSEIMKE